VIQYLCRNIHSEVFFLPKCAVIILISGRQRTATGSLQREDGNRLGKSILSKPAEERREDGPVRLRGVFGIRFLYTVTKADVLGGRNATGH